MSESLQLLNSCVGNISRLQDKAKSVSGMNLSALNVCTMAVEYARLNLGLALSEFL